MSGLMHERLYEELFTELSWVKTSISELSEVLNVQTYATQLLRYRVEPEEAAALEKVIALNFATVATMPFEEVRAKVVDAFREDTGKEWRQADGFLEEILNAKLAELGLRN